MTYWKKYGILLAALTFAMVGGEAIMVGYNLAAFGLFFTAMMIGLRLIRQD